MASIISVLVGMSAIFGTAEAIKETRSKARRSEHRSRKCNLVVRCPNSSQYSALLDNRRVVLSGDKLYVDTNTSLNTPFGHPFAGYYHPYPDTPYSGLISTISDDPPMMNWIYVDRDTYELKFGARPYAEHNFKGPWDCTRQERRLTFGGWEGFCVVLEESGFWGVHFDIDQNALSEKAAGRVVIEVELLRGEIRGVPRAKKDVVGTGKEKAEEGKKEARGKGEGDEVEINLESPGKVKVDVEASGNVECEMGEKGRVDAEKAKASE
ncbi:hypothetical protein LCER1_G000745 [Lachnellula cervina]|uniref:Uncharacterized protein n=1 Tax=Lachnellula cervina TaxID=1316786 RepID=A0A7D8ZE79_9HELO|nr:hypothetical protein LCER1_G000745 [Lachnellula cervina]